MCLHKQDLVAKWCLPRTPVLFNDNQQACTNWHKTVPLVNVLPPSMFPRPRLVGLLKVSHCSCLSFYIAQVLAQYVLLWRAFVAFPSSYCIHFHSARQMQKIWQPLAQELKQAAAFMQEKHPLETSKRALGAVRCPSFVNPLCQWGGCPRER